MMSTPRVAGLLVGDIRREPGARVKYGFLFDALARRFPLAGLCDVAPRGVERWTLMLSAAHPNRQVWRERYYKNSSAFRLRSRRAERWLAKLPERPDVVFQVSTLFDAGSNRTGLPNAIYTDHTARLSALRPDAGRSPFDERGRAAWIGLESRALHSAAHVFARSRRVRDSLVSEYGLPPERVSVIGGGVNLHRLPEVPERGETSSPSVLFVGKDFHRKGGDLLLRAFAEVRRFVPAARLMFLTAGPVPSGLPMDGVEVIPPTWDRQSIADLFRKADVFALPSRLETWGDALLEAMAFGLPCLGVSGQAMEEIILDGVTGRLVPGENVGALTGALAPLLESAHVRREWGGAGRRRVELEFTWDRVVERLAPTLAGAAKSGLPRTASDARHLLDQ